MLWVIRSLNGEFIEEFSKLLIGKRVKSVLELQGEISKLSKAMPIVELV